MRRDRAARAGFDMGVPFNELNRGFDLGFKPLPWGDQGYIPSTMQPAGELKAQGLKLKVPSSPGGPPPDAFTRLAAALTTNGNHR